MKTDNLDVGIDGAIGTITLTRARRLNALSRGTLADLVEAARWCDAHEQLKVVVVTGEGGSFSAGFDLADFATPDPALGVRGTADLGRLMAEAVTDMRAITIAAIDGHCVGGGVVLAAACDLRVATDSARFRIPEIDLGIPLAWGGIPRLVREIGPALTKELVLTCREFSADEARSIGFVNTVVSNDVVGHAMGLARSLADKPSYALRTTKQQVNAVTEEMIGTGRSAADADSLVFATHDAESREASARYLATRRSAARKARTER